MSGGETASPRPAYPVSEDIGSGSEFSHQGLSFAVPYFHRMYVQQIIWRIREQVFLLAGRQEPLVAEASRHKTNTERVCAAGILYAVGGGKGATGRRMVKTEGRENLGYLCAN